MTRVLAVRLDHVGDLLLCGPAIRAVRAGARDVTLLCGPRGAAAAPYLPGIDRVLTYDAPWIIQPPRPVDPERELGLVEQLGALDLDEAVIFTSFHQSALPMALLARLAGIPRVAAISEDYPGSLLDVRHQVDGGCHEVERALSLAAAAGYDLPGGDPGRLALRGVPDRAPGDLPARYVVLAPGATVPARTWRTSGYHEVAAALRGEGRGVVVTGTPTDRPVTARIAADLPDVVDLGGRTTFGELARVVAAADCVVTGNSGTAHVAAAVGAPVVSLFAPTVPAARWRPWGVPHVLLGDQELPCAGCRARECPLPGHPCIDDVDPAEVVAAIRSLAPQPATAAPTTTGARAS